MSDVNTPSMADPAAAGYEPERGVVWAASEGQIINLWLYVLCTLTFWLGVPLLYAAYRFMAVRAHRYELSDQRLVESTGLLFKRTEEVELYRVKDISVEQPPRQRLVGCGRVILHTSDRTSPIVVLNAVAQPLAVSNLIRDRVERCRVLKGVREIN